MAYTIQQIRLILIFALHENCKVGFLEDYSLRNK